ncbi:domain-containing protein [Seminavis robusta]|uniref:Domain-containing protein n=1 Tax=Seminavis robusta TaxID=568900 RepID=A0A9N8H6T4_9STRA|nr:domain-containing protein [Seminavis robusta]|eukprot:Sro52_g030960.1 domain-containing protein (750) ;mRNA; f:59211-61914
MNYKLVIFATLVSGAVAADHCVINHDTKCGTAGHLDRLNVASLDACKAKCSSTANCGFYSYRSTDKLCVTCMAEGNKQGFPGFTFYPLDPAKCPVEEVTAVGATTAGGVPLCDAPVHANMKCAWKHVDRLHRLVNQSVEQCQKACADDPACEFYSYKFKGSGGKHEKVCMGCGAGTANSMQHHHNFHLYSKGCVGKPPPMPQTKTWNGDLCARGTGDPHFMTFDGKKYDCQGDGDFILSRSLDSGFELQGRFGKVRRRPRVATHQGAVIKTGINGEPKVEIAYTKECAISYRIEDTLVDLDNNGGNTGTNMVAFFASGNTRTIEYDSGFSLKVQLRSWSGDCYLNVYLCLPETVADQRFVGILGTPDGNKNNDFTDRQGVSTGLAIRASKKEAHEHCVKTWCTHPSENLFNEPTASQQCNVVIPYDDDLETKVAEIATTNPEWFSLCDGDEECLMDALAADDIDQGVRTLIDGEADPEPPGIDEIEPATVPQEERPPGTPPPPPTEPAPTSSTPANERSGPIDETFTTKSPPGAMGDPHFKTHGGEMYDFHGNAQEEGILLNGAALVTETTTSDEWHFSKFAGRVLRYKSVSANHRIRREAHLHLGNGEKIMFKTFADFVKVEFMNESDDTLKGSLGLLGTYPDGQRVGRDGATIMEDVNMFGQEWQVKPDEPKLFHSYTADWVVPAGQACAMPVDSIEKSQLRKRRLANGLVEEEVEKACAHLQDPSDHKACVFDVIATQDPAMAGAW